MEIVFEWNVKKARTNFEKHRISFDEGRSIFSDPLLVTFSDNFHSEAEERLISIGMSERSRVLLVVHTEREELEEKIVI